MRRWLLIALLLCGCLKPVEPARPAADDAIAQILLRLDAIETRLAGGTPTPIPLEGLAEVSHAAWVDYSERQAASMESVADRIDGGELTTDEAVLDALESGSRKARLEAMRPVASKFAQASSAERPAMLRESAKGIRWHNP